MSRDTFEIYYFQNGRWSVHQSFESGERELALAEAQKVDKTLGFPVRLVRESFHSDTNTTEEVVSWQSAKAKQMGDADNMFGGGGASKKGPPQKKVQQKAQPSQPQQRRPEPKPAPPQPAMAARKPAAKKPAPAPAPQKKKAKKSSRGITAKVVRVVGKSLLFSMVAVVAVALLLNVATDKLHLLTDENNPAILAAVFVLCYAITAVRYLFQEFDINFGWSRKRKIEQRRGAPSAGDMLRRMRQAQTAADAANRDAPPPMAEADVEDMREHIAQDEAEEAGDRGSDDDFGTAVHEAPAEAPAAAPPQQEEPAAPQPAAKAEAPPPEAPAPKREEKKAPEKPAEPGVDPEARQGLMAFAREALGAATSEQPQLNAFSRFGMNLYVAGACAAMGQARKLARGAQLTMLRDSLQAAGNTPERAETFCAELPAHGKNPRYASMIQAGSAAMARQLNGQPAGTQELTALLNDWAKPEKRPSVPSAFTFLFTDIVNSTALTSQLGNAGAQRVVRAHNTAVRGAIQAQQGREVKHTGDGIMATFPSPIAAVQASIQAQKEIVAHSAANPAVAFSIRIGINVGEAVEEDNDFFGAAVQMTARICSVCTPANAWVSRAVVDACKGQRVGFIPRGAFQMKGIQQARPLYEVAYTDAHKEEIANL